MSATPVTSWVIAPMSTRPVENLSFERICAKKVPTMSAMPMRWSATRIAVRTDRGGSVQSVDLMTIASVCGSGSVAASGRQTSGSK